MVIEIPAYRSEELCHCNLEKRCEGLVLQGALFNDTRFLNSAVLIFREFFLPVGIRDEMSVQPICLRSCKLA